MLKSRLYEYLKKYLGEYLYGLEESQLDVALLSGRLNFSNANFKPAKVNELLLSLGLPITLKAGFIGSLHIQYHYLSLLSNPIQVTIDDLFLVLGPILMPATEPAEDRLETFASDEELSGEESLLQTGNTIETGLSDEEISPEDLSVADLKGIHARLRGKKLSVVEPGKWGQMEERLEPKAQTGTLAAYLHRLLKTLTLAVNNFHIRYEDDIYSYQQPFSCGVCLDSLVLRTEPVSVSFSHINSSELASERPASREDTCKSCVVRSLSVYFNPLSGMLIPTSLWEATLSSPIGIFDALPAYELRELMLQEAQSACSFHSLLAPISLKGAIRLKEKGVAVTLPLPKLQVRVTPDMMESVRSFQDYVVSVKLWGHMRRYRPCEKIVIANEESRTLPAKRKKIVRKWFLYALRFIKCKRRLIKLSENRQKPAYPSVIPHYNPPAKALSLSRPMPGSASALLSLAVTEYNRKKLSDEKSPIPKWLLNCEAQIRTEGLDIGLKDESEGEVRLTVGHTGVNVTIGKKKVGGEVMIGEVEVSMRRDTEKYSQLLLIGSKNEKTHSTKSSKCREMRSQEHAFACIFSYFPRPNRYEALMIPSSIICDAEGTIGSLSLTYTPTILKQLAALYLCFLPSSLPSLSRKHSTKTKAAPLQSCWIRLANSLDHSLQSSCLSLVFSLGEVSLSLRDDASDSLYEFKYPSSPLTFIKEKSRSTASILGLSLTTKSTFSLLVSFLTVKFIQSLRLSLGPLFAPSH